MAGIRPQTIGKEMPYGFAGCYARQPDMIANTRPCGGKVPIPFGAPLIYDSDTPGAVVQMGAAAMATQFVGVAGAEIKSSLAYLEQSTGQYAPGDAVSVFQRGAINVTCQRGTPALGGKVYVRITSNPSYSTAVVGGFEAEADSEKTVELTNCQWGGSTDANGTAELRILTMQNA